MPRIIASRRPLGTAFALIASLALTACGGSGSSGAPAFRTFVEDQFEATADTTEPVSVNGRSFRDRLDDDSTAYDDLLERELGG